MILLSHPTANQNVRQAALALVEAGLLKEFWTGLNWDVGGVLDRFLPATARKELGRRSFPDQLKPFLNTYPWREAGRLLSTQLGLSWLTRGETGLFSVDAVYFSLDRRVARRLIDNQQIAAVYAYDNGALETFRAAKKRGIKCIYEHPIVYWREARRLQQEEAELHPEWKSTLVALSDSEEKLARKDAELALADVVLVPSAFSKASLSHAPKLKAPVQIVPYGVPQSTTYAKQNRGAKLRVLFVGALTQAKGISYLFEAVERLKQHVDLTLIGKRISATMPTGAQLQKYRWIPSLAYDELLREMLSNDVLVLPSLHEGFGLVIGEAMAQGLAVITTPNTAGPDLITDGVDGFIVPVRSADAIAGKLEFLLSDRKLLSHIQESARHKAESWKWENYRRQLASVARAVVQ